MINRSTWQSWLWPCIVAIAFVLMLKSDIADARWVAKLSQEGSPAPALDPTSSTGYTLGQRHFLGLHERGDTYRWIAATQEVLASGPLAAPHYASDNVPLGRPQLLPRLYTAWLATISGALHLVTGEPIALSAERAALWEPVFAHVLVFAAAVVFMARRFGAPGAAGAALLVAFLPPLQGQFLPGTLTPRTWALFLAAYVIALACSRRATGATLACSTRSAVAAALALWLDPAFGFPAVLISAAAATASLLLREPPCSFLRWSVVGAALTLVGWLLDRSPWSTAAGELRYVHPLYACAWLGIGLALDGWQRRRSATRHAKRHVLQFSAAVPLIAALPYAQFANSYKGWLYSGASMRRLTSLDETALFESAFDWLARAPAAEVFALATPVLAALAWLGFALMRQRQQRPDAWRRHFVPALVLVLVLAFSIARIRWGVPALLVALPVIGGLVAHQTPLWRRAALILSAVFFCGIIAWGQRLPAPLLRPAARSGSAPADLEALVHRHFSHWLASHRPGKNVSVLAPPELSDSIVFHGGCRVLMSTAWESYSGLVAASRVLSAPEASEAEAVLQSREVTHVALPTWDRVLPLLVQEPKEPGRDTLYARLQRWVLPRYLRPIPYKLPAAPGFADQTLAVFALTHPQDEALSLSRLAEYFVEMDRSEPAALAAKVLAEAFPDDPNAAIARALVAAQTRNAAEFENLVARLAADVSADRTLLAWDRRVQRAIVLALGRKRDLAQAEIAACLGSASEEDLFELTPLQAYRLAGLARVHRLAFPSPQLESLLGALGAEYQR